MLSHPGVGQWLVQPCRSDELRQTAGSRGAGNSGLALQLVLLVPGPASLVERAAGLAGVSAARLAGNGE
jgi:hypothetical protein